jgi:hypothetical protein
VLTVSDSDSTKKAKVAAAATAARMTFDFGMSDMGRERIQVLEGLRYFAKGDTRSSGPETVPEPRDDVDVIFEDLFNMGLHMSPHQVLTDNLQKFHVQLHQLTPNAIVQISKFIWAVSSCEGHPTTEVFTKYYELYYQ